MTTHCFVCKDVPRWTPRSKPRVGDLTVCTACTAVNIMRRGGRLDAPTPEELAEGLRDPLLTFHTKAAANNLWRVGRFYGFA